ncbi:hypothetical protein Ancab_010903 [Ancistrocladus abbreviatus]
MEKTGPSLVFEVVNVINRSPKRNVLLQIERGDKDFEICVIPDENSDGTGRIGIQLSLNVKVSETFLNFSESAEKVSERAATIAAGAEVARSNIDGLCQFAAILNLNLAVINLLPLPALDGSSLALVLIEAARGGRKLPLEMEQRIMSSGIMFVALEGYFFS